MIKRLLLLCILPLASLFAISSCADVPDETESALYETHEALVIAGWPAGINVSPLLTGNLSPGVTWTSNTIPLTAVNYALGTRTYAASDTTSFTLQAVVSGTCAIQADGHWECQATNGQRYSARCPTIEPAHTPNLYRMGLSWTTWAGSDAPNSWYFAGTASIPVATRLQVNGSGTTTLQCGYVAGATNSYALGHY